MKFRIIGLFTCIFFSIQSFGSTEKFKTLYGELQRLNSEKYTGGLTKKHVNLAGRLINELRKDFPDYGCPTQDFFEGEIVRLGNNQLDDDEPEKMDYRLKLLVDLLDSEKQEIRDTVAYILAEIGPSADSTLPFLIDKQEEKDIKGNWFNYALTKISCKKWTEAHYSKVIPENSLPVSSNWDQYRHNAAIVITQLYLDPDVIYPPGTLSSAFEHFHFKKPKKRIEESLFKIISRGDMTNNKKLEAMQALQTLEIFNVEKLGSILEDFQPEEESLSWLKGELLIKIKHSLGIKETGFRIEKGFYHWAWSQDLCEYKSKARSLESIIINRLEFEQIPETQAALLEGLGCINSIAGAKVLQQYALSDDWQLQKAAVSALGQYDSLPEPAIAVLFEVYKSSWSKQVRRAALNSLVSLGKASLTETANDGEETITIRMGPYPIDHGLPWCDDSGKYSIDGSDWFYIDWIKGKLAEAPEGFPKEYLKDYGTRTFLKVDNGWLYGSDLGHYDGEFLFWPETGEPYVINEFGDIKAIVRVQDKIYAFGYETLINGDAGSLFELVQKDTGHWQANRILTLPSPPVSYAVTKDGILLLSDIPNDYAVINGKVKPLLCEKEFEEDYFN